MIKREWQGFEIGDAEAAGEMCGVAGLAYQAYTRREWPRYRKPPTFVARDTETGRKLYPLRRLSDRPEQGNGSGPVVETVEEWQKGRPGRGNWGGEGARAHYATKGRKPTVLPKGAGAVRCTECKAETRADGTGAPMFIRHEPACSEYRASRG